MYIIALRHKSTIKRRTISMVTWLDIISSEKLFFIQTLVTDRLHQHLVISIIIWYEFNNHVAISSLYWFAFWFKLKGTPNVFKSAIYYTSHVCFLTQGKLVIVFPSPFIVWSTTLLLPFFAWEIWVNIWCCFTLKYQRSRRFNSPLK